jgi:hypothetical protein
VGLVAVTLAAVLGVADALRADAAGDGDTARRAALRLADLPDGWTSARAGDDEPAYPDDPECADLRQAGRLAHGREAHSPDFSRTDTTTGVEFGVEQTVVVFGSARRARRYFDASTGPDTIACFEASFRVQPAGRDTFALEADEITPLSSDELPDLGDRAAGYHFVARIVGTARLQGDDAVPVTFDAFLFRVGRAVTILSFSTVGSFDEVPGTPEIASAAALRLAERV